MTITKIIKGNGLLASLLLFSSCMYNWYKMGTTAMEPNIKVCSLISIQEQQHYSYGDIVVIENVMEYPVMYRIVALSGDSIGVDDHICVLNGIKYHTDFMMHTKDIEDRTVSQITEKWTDGLNLMIWIDKNPIYQIYANMNPILVPENHVFVLGDYRTASVDSREFGAISIEKIKGKVVKVRERECSND